MRTVCGLDVHKDSIFVCILNENGILFQDKIGVLTPDLERLVDVLHEHGATEVCMESTSIYWMPVWRILESYFSLKLVNPYFIKQLPGKKSDVKDAEWIAICLLKDLIRGSYVPEDRIQQLRQYDRRIFDLNKDIVYKLTKLDAALQRCNIRISNYVSATDGKSYQKVVEKISDGVTDPKVLTGLIHGQILNRVGKDIITASLTDVITQTDIDVIRQIREEVMLAQKHRDECQAKMEELCSKCFPKQMKNLQTVPGVSLRSATSVIAELGTDMSSFEDAAHLVSWSGLKPRNDESTGKIKSRKITHGNKFLRKTLIECSWAAAKTRGCFYNTFYKLTHALCGLGRPFELLVRRGNSYIISSPLSIVVASAYALLRSHNATHSA